ncbi:arginine--tRNA ligase [Mucilaginibacter pedocola]|uniref:arginine--tRNA ligase n=1 Tax=Mucilaginibacter pedocola TaxID=1792845 RepID=UPI00138FD3CB|nr:arginine--tRNA ligase [Mucilaginibacter pedocola]
MEFIIEAVVKAVKELYQTDIAAKDVNLQETRKEFEGQVTLVTFPYTKVSRKGPEQTGGEIGEYLKENVAEISGFNVVKGFLNLSFSDGFWLDKLKGEIALDDFAVAVPNSKKVMVEYSSPNTNKPLHLGHIRNNLLGFSVAQILDAAGYEVIKTNLVNDRGIHICKSMLAWQRFGNDETPESAAIKGDHLVGKYYVMFESKMREQLKPILSAVYDDGDLSAFTDIQKPKVQALLSNIAKLKDLVVQTPDNNTKALNDLNAKIAADEDKVKEIAKTATELMQQAQQMLQKWEAGDAETIKLWEIMNGWVYAGFAETYKSLGVAFDKFYYESNTYLLGKDTVEEGLASGVFFKKEDGSVWIDLTADGLDQKLVLRADGTSVYITQDIGTAQLKYDDFKMDESIYVVGNEQDYHFKVLFLILEKLGKSWAKGLYHLSYGMVDLPSGKMKSREGTVVDADDLMADMYKTAADTTEEMGKVEGLSEEEKDKLFRTIGMGALKYFLLKVDPKKRLLFDPKESIDFQGHTGPFIQYTHARVKSVLSKAGYNAETSTSDVETLGAAERDLIVLLSKFPQTIQDAAATHSPAVIANYVYEVAKNYNKFYHENPIMQAETESLKQFRLQLSAATAKVINKGMGLLGIDVPERM